MNPGELLTRGTIWVALAFYALGEIFRLVARQRPRWEKTARWFWTIGCLAYLAHVAAAFQFHHAWSHAAAAADTARQTATKFGFNWGGGLWFNYFFTAIWLADVLRWWISPRNYSRARIWLASVRAFFLFMIFNATVVFPTGAVRWFGLVICLGVTLAWWLQPSRKT